MGGYPVQVEITSPARFERSQLLLRVLLALVIGWIGVTAGGLVTALFFVLPLVAAVSISASGPEHYIREVAPKLWRPLEWLLQLSAYMLLVVDTFPGRTPPVRIDIRYTAAPTMRSALGRLVTSIPSGIVLCLLWAVAAFAWVIAAVAVLLGLSVPDPILGFQHGVVRWQARLVAYHASLVDEYPPFSLHGDDRHAGTLPEARAR